jgi:hypothetical protein
MSKPAMRAGAKQGGLFANCEVGNGPVVAALPVEA